MRSPCAIPFSQEGQDFAPWVICKFSHSELRMPFGAYCDGHEWHNASSIEYKQDVAKLTVNNALEVIAALKPVTFKYKDGADQLRIGFIAEEVPEPVVTKDRKSLSLMGAGRAHLNLAVHVIKNRVRTEITP